MVRVINVAQPLAAVPAWQAARAQLEAAAIRRHAAQHIRRRNKLLVVWVPVALNFKLGSNDTLSLHHGDDAGPFLTLSVHQVGVAHNVHAHACARQHDGEAIDVAHKADAPLSVVIVSRAHKRDDNDVALFALMIALYSNCFVSRP